MSAHLKALEDVITSMPSTYEDVWKMYMQINQVREGRGIERNEVNRLVQKYPLSKLAEWVKVKNSLVCNAIESSDALRKYAEKLAPSMKRSSSSVAKGIMEHLRDANGVFVGREDVVSFSKHGKVLSMQFVDPHDLEAIKNKLKPAKVTF